MKMFDIHTALVVERRWNPLSTFGPTIGFKYHFFQLDAWVSDCFSFLLVVSDLA